MEARQAFNKHGTRADQLPGERVANELILFSLVQCYCRDWTAVYSLLAITGIAGIRANNPCLVVLEFKNFGAKIGTKPASDAEVHVNFRGSHDGCSFPNKDLYD
jgi:hypothetical protein